VVSALFRRQHSGEGAYIDLAMLDATISAMGWAVSNYLIAGVEAQPIGNQNTTAAPSGAFRCADGQINIAANKQEQFERLCDLVGLSALKTDPRFAEREARKANRAALNALLDEALGAQGAAEWEDLLNANGIPAGRILSIPEILAHPQIAARGLIHEIPMGQPGLETVKVCRAGYSLGTACRPHAPHRPCWGPTMPRYSARWAGTRRCWRR
jgi:crotonobetainyl-CoA:carnitine CoA-transferase CaiB-like acyl-CoA transferase